MSKTTENYGFTKPEVGEFFSLETWNGNMDKIDKELKKREDAQKESDNSLMNPEFTEAKERKNLTSGEKIHLMLGKISKFFSDMKAIAFSGSYNDLVDKPKIPTVLNNQTTTEEGFALDARQANPNIDGTLAKQVADLNGSLNSKINSLNPSNAIRSYKRVGYLATSGGGWYRFAEIIFTYDTSAKGSEYQCIEATVRQTFNNGLGCFHKVSLYLIYDDRAKMTVVGQGTNVLTKVRAVRKDNIIYLDVYSSTIKNETEFLINIPLKGGIMSARCIDTNLVPETSDGESIVCSVNFATNI